MLVSNKIESILCLAGLENFIKEIGPTVPEEIETQLRLYENLKNDDLDELSTKWNRVQSDFTDLNSAFQVQCLFTIKSCKLFKYCLSQLIKYLQFHCKYFENK